MANIKETEKIFDVTPIHVPILLNSITGVGKSTFLKEYFEEKGYRVITIFLGQLADAADFLGTMYREEIEVNNKKHMVTKYASPLFWPLDENEKVVIFLDEINRTRPDLIQCVFDLTLNRKLNGKSLGKYVRIIAAMNPVSDEYNVIEFDQAFINRWRIIDFRPTVEEFISYATKIKANKYVISFINNNRGLLDPQSTALPNTMQPTRRAWIAKVSDTLNAHPELINDLELLQNILMADVGLSASSQFIKFIKELQASMSAAKIITNWSKEVEEKVKKLSSTEIVALNKEIEFYLDENTEVIFNSGPKSEQFYANNLFSYLKIIPTECAAEFYGLIQSSEANRKEEYKKANNGKMNGYVVGWGDKVLDMCGGMLLKWFLNIVRGDSEHDKEVKQMIAQDKEEPKEWDNTTTEPKSNEIDSDIEDLLSSI